MPSVSFCGKLTHLLESIVKLQPLLSSCQGSILAEYNLMSFIHTVLPSRNSFSLLIVWVTPGHPLDLLSNLKLH